MCFPILGVPFLGGPNNKDYSISGSILGSLSFGKLPYSYTRSYTYYPAVHVWGQYLRVRSCQVLLPGSQDNGQESGNYSSIQCNGIIC